MKETPLEKYCNDLADLSLKWYEDQVQRKYYLRDIYNQLVRSATSIGANLAEAKFAQSDADYKSKISIALKEANETRYWIQRLVVNKSIDSLTESKFSELIEQILNILISIRKKI